MRIEEDVKLDFCDVLIKPKRSDSPSRYKVDLNCKYKFLNSEATWEGIPIFAANMATVGTFAMAKVLDEKSLLTCLHKHYPLESLLNNFSKNYFYTIGIKDEDFEKLEIFSKSFRPSKICIDVANGYTKYFVNKCKIIRDKYPDAIIMAGNVCTSEMVQELLFAGVDIVKIGIGPGAVCTTRVVTGCGYPQLSAILECADTAHGLKGHVCADGGCVSSGDIAKAFGAGADFVMLGSMLSGTDECEGNWSYNGLNKTHLEFYGMSSKTAMDNFHGGQSEYKASEGKKVSVPYKGPVNDVLNEILGGLRSTCTMVGTEKLQDLSKCTTFIKVNRTHNTFFGN